MKRIAIVSYAGKTVYAVSVFGETGLIKLKYNNAKTFNTGFEMYKFVVKLLEINYLPVNYTIEYGCKLYDIVWCDITNPFNHDDFLFHENTPLGET